MTRALGWRRAPDDPRDRNAAEKLRAVAIPYAATVKPYVVEVLDQGARGTCAANAAAQALRIAHVRQGVVNPPLASRLMSYYCSRGWEGTTGEDSGSYIKDHFRTYAKIGFCPESAWPYSDDDRYKIMPPPEAFREAFDQRSPDTAYHRIIAYGADRIMQVKQAIAAGHAVVFGTDVSEDFCSGMLDPVAEKPPIGKQIAGGHALCCVGFEGDVFEICNSWGTSFADGGYVKFTADYMTWNVTDDLWLVDSAPPPFMLGAVPAAVV